MPLITPGRAAEYERVYAKPERQADLAALRERIGKLFTGRKVLELARARSFPENRVRIVSGDCHAPPDSGRNHDALFAGFWWSHVPLTRMDAFLQTARQAVASGALVAFLDNRQVPGSSTAVSRHDQEGKTYQLRKLDDGSTHEMLKNFPAEGELIQRAARHGWGAHVELFEHYWLLTYWAPK